MPWSILLFIILALIGCTSSLTAPNSLPAPTPLPQPAPLTPTISQTVHLSSTTNSRWRCHPSGGLSCFDDLGDVTMISADEGWLGNHLYYGQRPGESESSWQRLPQSHMPAFHSLDMLSPTEGWASTKQGFIRLFKNNTNQWMYEVIDENSYFSDIDMLSSTEGWGVGIGGIDRYYDNQWHIEEIIDERFTAIAMISPTEGWIGTEDNLQPFYYYDGQSWQPYDSSYLKNPDYLDYIGPINHIVVVDNNHIWVGSQQGILHYQEGEWAFQLQGKSVQSISMVSRTEGWAISWREMFHYHEGGWQPVNLPVDKILYSVDMVDGTEGWAVGVDGVLLHYYDNQWHLVSQNPFSRYPYSTTFYDLAWFDEEDIGWAVGTFGGDGLIIGYEAGTWQTVEQIPEQFLFALDMVSPELGWAVGEGVILHYHNGTWEVAHSLDATVELRDIDLWDAQTGWAVGQVSENRDSPGGIWQYQQGAWQRLGSPVRERLQAVQMVSPDEAWAVGHAGLVLHYQNGQWVDETFIKGASSDDSFTDIQMLSPTSGWLIGTLGLFHYQDGQWQEVDSPTPFSAMFMLSDNEGWFAGARQFENHHYVESYLWHYHNGEWTQVEKPLHQHQIRAIHMLNEHAGWAVGDSILQYTDAP